MGGSLSYVWRGLGIGLGLIAMLWHPSPEWIEHAYVNGVYPGWEHFIHAVGQPLPWSLGDIAGLSGIALMLLCIYRAIRLRSFVPLIDLLSVAGLYAFWFEAAWGWNYNRAPIETRLAFSSSHVNPAAVERLRARAIAETNALAPVAHAHGNEALDIPALYATWLPVVQRGGDTWTPIVAEPKPTIADPFMAMTGTTGYINPLTLNSHLASDLFWFERPFSLSHEWTHVAGYAREDEANYVAIITCTRSPDPVVQYSGWLELFLYLPRSPKHETEKAFNPLVWQDFKAIGERNKRRINVNLSRWSWRTYNTYLKSNHVASGVQNYNEVTRLVLGIPLDRAGLPIVTSPSS